MKIDRDNKYYSFSVKDDGRGFDYNGKSTLMKNEGYGLYSINERLDSIQGHLVIESKLGQGTKTTISIPVENV